MKKLLLLFFLILAIGFSTNTQAQLLDVLKKKTEEQIKKEGERRVDDKINKGVKKGYDEVEKQIEGDDNEGKNSTKSTDAKDSKVGESVTKENEVSTQFTSSSKYDFVPGEKMIYYDDFSQDAVGDFPALWTANAPGEINTISIAPGNWLNLNSTDGNYFYLNSIDFPKNFIMEFDIVPKKTGGRVAADLILYCEDKPKEMDNTVHPGKSGIHITLEKENWNTLGYKKGETDHILGSSKVNPVVPEKVNHVIIWVQNRRLRIYHKEAKVLDMPTNIYDGTKFSRFCFRLPRGVSSGSFISNLRITDAAPDMRSKLITEGILITYGIYFDVNKDIVKPESFGTLKEIAAVLQENPKVNIKIIGHTDSDGDDKSNLDLSKRRAASVKDALVKNFSIDAARIETDGKGEGAPIAPNDSGVNKALNRRVEFIKL